MKGEQQTPSDTPEDEALKGGDIGKAPKDKRRLYRIYAMIGALTVSLICLVAISLLIYYHFPERYIDNPAMQSLIRDVILILASTVTFTLGVLGGATT